MAAALTRGGLAAAVNSLVSRLDLDVRVDVRTPRLPSEIEASAYFIVAALGGRFDVAGGPGGGMRLTAELPLGER